MRISPNSGIVVPEVGVEYAALYVGSNWWRTEMGRIRPIKVLLTESGEWEFSDPDKGTPLEIEDFCDVDYEIVGRWDDKTSTGQTWQGYAAEQYGQVLRQRALAHRLSDFGIQRAPEHYLPHCAEMAVRRDLTLTFDELDKLLRAAGF
jgi:hypothetical protein